MDVDRDEARHGHVRHRDGLRLAAGQLRDPGLGHRRHGLRGVVPRPAGPYAADGAYFASKGVDNGPLHALQNGVSGGNGVYAYGSTSAFPSSTFNSANYWVDVVFSAA